MASCRYSCPLARRWPREARQRRKLLKRLSWVGLPQERVARVQPVLRTNLRPCFIPWRSRPPPRRSDLVGVYQAAGTEPFEYFGKIRGVQREAAFATAQHAMRPRHRGTDIPGAMHHDRAHERVVIAGIEPGEPDRAAMLAGIHALGAISARGRGIRTGGVRKALEPARVPGIGTPAMRNEIRFHAAAGEIDNVKPRQAGWQGEIRNRHHI